MIPYETDDYSFVDALNAFGDVLAQNETFLVASHRNPDGDTIGSMIALSLCLEQLGKRVIRFQQDEVPYNYRFLPTADLVTKSVPYTPDVTILVDCGAPERIGNPFPEEGWGETIVVVDHHKTYNDAFADLYIRDPRASSAGEVVYEIIKKYGKLTHAIAEAIYTCVITDTNCFRYAATSSDTFKVAGDMLDMGVKPWDMSSRIYESHPVERIQIMAEVLNTLRLSDSGALATLTITRKLLEKYNASEDIVDGFINYARGIQGVEIATQMMEEDDDLWRISFRSRGNIDCSELAEAFGGGGHKNSAGCRIRGTCDEVRSKLDKALSSIIERKG